MTMPGPQSFYLTHGPRSDPARHLAEISRFPPEIGALCKIVQGVLMHDAAPALYGLKVSDFAHFSRKTLTVEQRLEQFCTASGVLDLSQRPPHSRMIATCRDYALLLTGLLRVHQMPSRVRCGFATYFTEGQFDDHWICEVWCEETRRWRMVDAQLDAAHQRAYKIGFDPLDVPADQFLTADRAWCAVRGGTAEPRDFNAGTSARGDWIICMNLARDYLALCKQETSDWDRWREAPEAARTPSAKRQTWADALADEIAAKAADGQRAQSETLPGPPFW